MSKIFKPEVVAQFEEKLSDAEMIHIEQSLKDTLKLYQLPYTRQTLKAMLMTYKQIIRIGGPENGLTMAQVFYGVCVEKCLDSLEKKVAKFKTDLPI